MSVVRVEGVVVLVLFDKVEAVILPFINREKAVVLASIDKSGALELAFVGGEKDVVFACIGEVEATEFSTEEGIVSGSRVGRDGAAAIR